MREPRILIVDDEPIRSLLGRAFRLVGYDVVEAATGEEALFYLEKELFDLMILDMQLPGVDGKEIILLARERWPNLLIIVLTGHASLDGAVLALRSQVVNYLQKPIAFEEILDAVADALAKHEARAQKLHLMKLVAKYPELLSSSDSEPSTSRSVGKPQRRTLFERPLLLDRSKRSVSFTDTPKKVVTLTKGEVAVLSILMSYPEQVLSCEQIVQAAWGYETDEDSAKSVIRPYISRLRKKLRADGKKPRLIHTVRNRGYVFSHDNG